MSQTSQKKTFDLIMRPEPKATIINQQPSAGLKVSQVTLDAIEQTKIEERLREHKLQGGIQA